MLDKTQALRLDNEIKALEQGILQEKQLNAPDPNSAQPMPGNQALFEQQKLLHEELELINKTQKIMEEKKSLENKYKAIQPGLEVVVNTLQMEISDMSKKELEQMLQRLQMKPDVRDVKAIITDHEDSYSNSKLQTNPINSPRPAPDRTGARLDNDGQQQTRNQNNNRRIQQSVLLPGPNQQSNLLLQIRDRDNTTTNYVGPAAPIVKYAAGKKQNDLENAKRKSLANQKQNTVKDNAEEIAITKRDNNEEATDRRSPYKMPRPEPTNLKGE